MKPKLLANRILGILFGLILLFATATFALAQENTGSIQGTVKDSAGAAIPGAKVTASSPTLVRSIDVTTNKEGFYRFPKLPAGIYTVTVTQNGFKTVNNENITVVLGSELTLDVALSAGNVSESVTISAAAEAIDVTSSKASTNITEKFIDVTPKGRTFNSLLQVAPGVIFDLKAGSSPGGATGTSGNNPGGGVGGYSVNGASGSENAFIIDGVEVSNIRNAALGRESAIPFEFIREVQVKSAGFEAEFGGATGGVVNVTTKSGTNDFHGQASLEFTNAGMNSNTRGFWQLQAVDPSRGEFFRQREDNYRSFFPILELGGPLVKDRLNFFAAYAPELNYVERSVPFNAGARTTTSRTFRHYNITRLDYAPTQKIQFNTSYIWTPIRISGLLTGVDPRVAPPTNDLSIQGGYTPANAYTASFTYTPTSKLILSARYGYKFLNDKGNTYGLPTVPRYVYQTATSGPSYSGPVVPAQFANASGYQNVSSTFQVLKDITTRHNVYLDASYNVSNLLGNHTFKGGYSLNRMSNDVNDDHINGLFLINWGTGFTRGSLNNRRGTYGYYIWQDGIRHNSVANSRNQGFYIQDQWQVVPRVTLNLGVRFENEFLPPFTPVVNGVKVANPISFGWGDKIAPRFGGAWDVLGTGKWKISASYGEFYDTLKYELARTSFGGDYWHNRVYELNDPDITKLSKATPGALGPLIIDIDNRTIPINAQGQIDGIDPAIKPMLSREFVVASEHRLWNNFVFSARYTRKMLVRAIEDIGVLDAEENEVYTIGNPGFGATDAKRFTAPNGQPLTPKAQRDYDGIEFRFDQRFTEGALRNLNFFATYTYSRLYGNWPGLSNSDENGRSQPNVSRAFDLTPNNFDSKGQNVYGRLPTDRPHVLKLYPSYQWVTKAGATDFSLAQYVASGTPLSSTVTVIVPVFFNGRGDLGRTPTVSQTDILVAHTFNLTERVRAKVSANILNLFNQAAVISASTGINRNGNINISNEDFLKGFDVNAFLRPADSSVAPARNPIYGLPTAFQGIREIRLGFRLIF